MSGKKMVEDALKELGKETLVTHNGCLYRSGLLDSNDVIQLILELELRSGKQLEIDKLVQSDLTIQSLAAALHSS